jgi:uncharacterized protein (TIGR02678 family)
MSTLKTILAATELDELRAARRHLLMHPFVIQRVEPEIFRIIARHRQTLQSWFAEQVGWKLVVDRDAGFARLHKVSARLTATHAAQVSGRAAFNRRRYVLLCLALAALEESPAQTTLARLAELIESLSSADPSLEAFDSNLGPERRALVDALRFLIERNVLTVRDGDAEGYVASRESGDALFDVNDRLLAQCIAAPMPPALLPTSADDPMSLLHEIYPETDEGQRQRSRHQVLRRLLDEPVLYYDELAPREREWLLHSLGFVESLLESQLGLQSERHREGMAAVDPQGELTDVAFPDGGSTAKHAALLLCERLASRGAEAWRTGASATFSKAELLEITEQLVREYGERCSWSVAYRGGPEGAALLLCDSSALLEAFRLLERAADGHGWRPTPAVARFRPLEPGLETKSARRRGPTDHPAPRPRVHSV